MSAGFDMYEETIGRPNGNCKVSGYSEYDSLTGYAVHKSEIVGITLDGWKVRHTVEIVNLGRPDRGIPIDPEAQMGAESLNYERSGSLDAAYERVRILTEERKQRAHVALVAHLQANGPQMIEALLSLTEWEIVATLRSYMRSRPDVFVRLYKSPAIWGLHGQTYTPQLKDLRPPQTAFVIRDALIEKGPMTQRELIAATRLSRSCVQNVVGSWPTMFCVVGKRKWDDAKTASIIVGVVGIHDQEAQP